jgi:hypothetical protein
MAPEGDDFLLGMETCGCDDEVLYLHGRCHPGAPLRVTVERRGGLWRVLCAECGAEIVRFKVKVSEANRA